MKLTHPDGTELGATLVQGGDAGWVVIAGATGVPHRYYEPLSEWLAEECRVNVLSFDYRGVGASRPASLKGYQASYRDWASDLEAAVTYAASRGPVVVVGHSFGGHAFGMTDAHTQTRGLYTFATGAGWSGYMTPAESRRVWALWNVVLPPLVSWKGYAPFRLLRLGEDLPKGVYEDWRRWCMSPRYFFDDPKADFVERFSRVRVPVVGVNSVDDAWASPASARAFLSHYPNVTCVSIKPDEVGLHSIGHLAYVRPACRALWGELTEWVDARFTAAGR